MGRDCLPLPTVRDFELDDFVPAAAAVADDDDDVS
jgi:hypothetical protein